MNNVYLIIDPYKLMEQHSQRDGLLRNILLTYCYDILYHFFDVPY